ncbi:unnamed protein product [Prunus armeniaca]
MSPRAPRHKPKSTQAALCSNGAKAYASLHIFHLEIIFCTSSCKTRLAASAIEAEAHAALSGVYLATQMGISHAVFESDSKELVQSVKGHILRSFDTFRNQEISTGAGAIREQQFEEPAVVSDRTLGTGCPVVQTKQQMLQLLKLKGGCVMRFGKPASHPLWSLCCKLMGSHVPLQCEHWLLEADTLPIWEV